jgi:CubicO group peptidase (beta-lactamase class C family)
MKIFFTLCAMLLSVTLFGCGGDSSINPTNPPKVNYSYQVPVNLGDGWSVGSLEDHHFDVSRIESLITAMKQGQYPELDGILVARQGQLLFEQYFHGYSATKLHETQSAIKSVDSAMVGILLAQGLITSVHRPIVDYLPPMADVDWSHQKDQISLADLMTMRSGLDCLESNVSGCNTDNINQSHNWADFTLSQSMSQQPGHYFSYFSGLNLVMHKIIEYQTGMAFEDYLVSNLFAPLGIDNFRFDHSPSGEALGAHMLPRDMAKFGQLYLNDGLWHGQRIIEQSWISESTAPQVDDGQWLEQFHYGYWWWLYDGAKAQTSISFIGARGSRGQWIMLFPEYEMVLVFTGNKDSDVAMSIAEQYFIPSE